MNEVLNKQFLEILYLESKTDKNFLRLVTHDGFHFQQFYLHFVHTESEGGGVFQHSVHLYLGVRTTFSSITCSTPIS